MNICPINTISTNNKYKKQPSLISTCSTYNNVAFESKKKFAKKIFTRNSYIPAITTTAAGAISAAGAKSSNEVLPSRDEFKKMLDSSPMQEDPKRNEYCVEAFLKFYDTNPKYALKFYNMKRSDGTLLRNLDLDYIFLNKIFRHYSNYHSKLFYDKPEELKNKYIFLQQLIDMKVPSGSYMFDKAEDAIYVMNIPDRNVEDSKIPIAQKRIIEILKMKNQDNTLRFSMKKDSYGLEEGIEFLTEKPEIAQKYIDMKNEKGKPRFGLLDIAFIGQSYGYYPSDENWFSATGDTKALDTLLSLKRNDGSYIYDSVPHCYDVELYKKYPEEFIKLANQKDDKGKYIESMYLQYYGNTLETMKKYPDEYQKFIETYPYYVGKGMKPDKFEGIYKNIDKIKPQLERKTAVRYLRY